VAVVAGIEERGRVVTEPGVHVDTLVEQLLHGLGVSLARRVLELFGLGECRRLRDGEHQGESDGQVHGVSLITCGAILAPVTAPFEARF